MSALHPCVACQRHINVDESACPFCKAEVPEGFGPSALARAASAVNRPLSRAAILFAGATAIAACSSGTALPGSSGGTSGSSGGSSGSSGSSGEVQALYGPAPVEDAGDAGMDSPGPVALYGPAPVDSGNG